MAQSGLDHGHLCLVRLFVLPAINPRPCALPLWTLVFHKVLPSNSWPLGLQPGLTLLAPASGTSPAEIDSGVRGSAVQMTPKGP